MKIESMEQPTEERIAHEQEATYRQGLCRNWMLRHGQRPDSLSRLSTTSDVAVLLAAAGAVALHATGLAIGLAVLGLIASHAMNRSFRSLEKLAFADLEREAAGETFKRHASQRSPFYALAKVAMKSRVRAKQAWVDKRMELFLKRRAHKNQDAEILGNQVLRLGSIRASADADRNGEFQFARA
jgi:hypothetical protein